MPTYVNGNPSGMMIEACAGLLDGDNPVDCIRKEVEEETGLLLPTVIGSLPNSYHVFHHKGRETLKTTYWFLMHVEGSPALTPQEEEGIEDVKWISRPEWINDAPPSYPQTKAYMQQYFSQHLIGE